MEPLSLEKRQSIVIDAMRFPLIVLVLFIHVLPPDLKPVEINFTSMGLYLFLSEMFSHNFGRIAVPCFFLFSGYFFFIKMQKWSSRFYITQLKKRMTTLVIPYLLWNMLLLILVYCKAHLFDYFQIRQHDELTFLQENSLLQLLWLPIDLPLWYLRDLICMTLLTPLFYFLFRYTKVYGLLALLMLYLTAWGTNIPGFSMTAFLFFGAGAYLGIYKKNMLLTRPAVKLVCLLAAIPLLLAATLYNGIEPQHEHIIRFFVPLGVYTAINIMNRLVDNDSIRQICIRYAPTVFFIYAIHEFYIKNWLKGIFYRTPLSGSGYGMMTGYILMPFAALFICMGLYYLWKKLSPKSLSILVGGRVTNNQKLA